MKLSIAALVTVFALPAAAALSPPPQGSTRNDPPPAATKDAGKKPASPVARNDCRTPKKPKKPAREVSRS